MARRVIAYIDGFNLYHAIADLGESSLKWVNLWSLTASLLRTNEQLTAVKYCSAYATWMAGPFSRHLRYVRALECVGVLPIMGRFKSKPRRCQACNARWLSHEEKETDVNIAIHLVRDAMLNQFDRAILISADSDLVPAVDLAAQHDHTKEIFVAAPPGRYASARDLKPRLEITIGRIRKNLFPASLTHPDGKTVTRPSEYDP